MMILVFQITYKACNRLITENAMFMTIPLCIISEFPVSLNQCQHVRLWLSISGNPSEKLHCGNLVNKAYYIHMLVSIVCPKLWQVLFHMQIPRLLSNVAGGSEWSSVYFGYWLQHTGVWHCATQGFVQVCYSCWEDWLLLSFQRQEVVSLCSRLVNRR